MNLKHLTLTTLCLGLMWLLSGPSGYAQVTLTSGSPYSQYVTNLAGLGVTVSNVTINCDTIPFGFPAQPQMGAFSNGAASSLGMSSGLVMSSGNINGTGGFVGNPGNPQLTSLILPANPGSTTNDACVVTFDFEAQCDTVTFNFVMASEEYTASFQLSYEDIFAAHVTGPTFPTPTNVALLPNGQHVSVFNTNNNTNPQYFVDNPTGLNGFTQGSTITLTAKIAVNPCQVYTMTFAIADEQDNAVDTGVFIEPLKCGSTPPSVVAMNFNNPDSKQAVEDCVDGFFRFYRSSSTPNTQAEVINFTLSGTAVNGGVDYDIPTVPVVIPIGQDSIDVPANVVSDGLVEGQETIILTLNTISCATTSDTIFILDPFEYSAGPDKVVCSGESETIGGLADPTINYSWTFAPGLQAPYNIANPTVQFNVLSDQTVNYQLTVTDQNGCQFQDDVTVAFLAPPLNAFSMATEACEDEVVTITFSAPTTPLNTYQWDFGPGAFVVGGSGQGPYLVSWPTAGVKDVSLVVKRGNCESPPVTHQITIHPIPTATFIAQGPICQNEAAIVQYTGNASPNATYNWDLDGGTAGGTGQGPFTVTWPTPGIKTIKLIVEENNCVGTEFTQTIQVFEVPSAAFSAPTSICVEDMAQVVYTGSASGTAAYAWTFADGQVLSGTGVGPYSMFWPTAGVKDICLQVEENGCTSPLVCQQVTVNAAPSLSINPVADQCFQGNSFSFTTSGGTADNYQWNFGPSALPAVSGDPNPGPIVYQNFGSQTVTLVATENGCVGDTAYAFFEVIEEPIADFTSSANSTCTNDCVTFTYVGGTSGPNTAFFWDFGPNAVPQTSTLESPPCVYFKEGGVQAVKLTVSRGICVDEMIMNINTYESPVVSAGLDQSFCEGDGGVQLDATTEGGTMPYFYQWTSEVDPNGGISNANIEDPTMNPQFVVATDSVKYYYQVTDVNGCKSNLDSAVVIVKAKPIMDAGRDTSICSTGPGAFLLGGTAANNMAPQPIQPYWVPSTGIPADTIWSPYARPDTTTIYTLIGVSANGCTSDVNTLDTVSTVTITVNAMPVADAGRDTIICFGESIQLFGYGYDAGPSYDFSWTPALPGMINDPTSPTPIVSPDQTTTYTLSVTSNGCVSEGDQVTVTVNTIPTVDAGNDWTVCYNEGAQLEGGVDGDPNASGYTFSWTPTIGLDDPTAANPIANPTTTTTYTVTATSEYGCESNADEVLVTIKPTPEVFAISPDTVICSGDTISLKSGHLFNTAVGSPVVYSWQPIGSIVSDVYQPEVLVAPTRTTIFTVQTSIGAGDCPTMDSIIVTVNPAVEATITADTTRICPGEQVQFIATGGLGNADFSWAPAIGLSDASVSDPVASPGFSTTYLLTVSEGVCSDTASISMTVNPPVEADYFASIAEGCAPLTVSFFDNTNNGVAYRWNFNDESPMTNEANPVHVFEAAGSYDVSLTVTGAGGCTDEITKVTVQVGEPGAASFVSDAPADLNLPLPNPVVNFTDLSSGAVSWFWEFGDGNVSDQASPMHTYTEEGDYLVTLTVTDEFGCVSTVSYEPYHIYRPDVMIPTVFTPNGDGVNDEFLITYNGVEDVSIAVFDRWGREVFVSQSAQEGWRPSSEKAGVYFYAVKIGEKVYKGDLTLLR
ncbi:PKD domain-containing protein [Pontibacter sp. G13]|uniref:PKD domain-containing protein n=1 Tax=Pontibacter sp. G13 TaxID=3074898 RepID=UPI00288AF2D0|nr:PKD domain-containing protein [Pontibacter sp. G13]WNJ18077.1 PKD domain-containing protein [Pontibacter sp. G13]